MINKITTVYCLLFVFLVITSQAQTQSENYIKTTTYKVATTVKIAAPTVAQAGRSVTYFDGLGRPKQNIAVRQGGDKVDNNLLDWKTNWTIGSGSIGTFFVQNGATLENNRVQGLDPFGQNSILWKCGSDVTNDADGGWNSATIAIDKAYAYRYAVWVKRSGSQDGHTHHGTQNVLNLDGTVNTNAYFWNGDLPLVDKWYLMVGIVHPSTYSGGGSGISGIYDTSGNKVLSGTDFKWSPTTVNSLFRSYFYYAIDVNTTQYFYAPNLQKIDGSEASIAGLIAGVQAQDIVTNIAYDAFGRQDKEYLSYATNNTGIGDIRTNALAETNAFYNTSKYQNTLNPYSQKDLEASPLNRVLKQAAPGNDWKLTSGHEIKLGYQTNIAGEVKLFTASATWNTTFGLYEIALGNSAGTTFYAADQLYKTVTYDENTTITPLETAGSTVEFKNKEGQVVLKRTYDATVKHDTYYVYDIYGNLIYVIPPKADASITSAVLNDLCYQYKYDFRNRVVEKKLPGKQWEFIVYDKLDRVVATGPAASPFSDLTSKGWSATKYDAFNRPVITAWLPSAATITTAVRKTLQDTQNGSAIISETKIATTTNTIVPATTGVAFRYSTVAWPTTGYHVLTVNYYDDYNYPGAPVIPATVAGTDQAVFYNTTVKPKGLATGTWVRILETSILYKNELGYTLYDAKARPVRSYIQNHLGGYTYTDSKLDAFSGQLKYSITKHKRLATDAELTTKDAFVYSAQDRLLTQTHQINSGAIELIASNTYDELGQLISKKVGNTTMASTQNINYAYNIRGWMTGINDVNSLAKTGDPKDLFAFKISYNDITDVTKKLYNGNISQTFWATDNADKAIKNYVYTYDKLNRLKSSTDNTTFFNEDNILYDKNGNITKLKRKGHLIENPSITVPANFGLMDDLTYTYDSGNRLQTVSDLGNETFGFKDDVTGAGVVDTTVDYTYDTNGNMLTDSNKGITGIVYNQLDLPTKITFATSGNIVYIYNATGQKVQKVVNATSLPAVTTDYLGGYQYNNNVLKFFPTAEGYVEPSGSTYKYVYQYKDHLGNIRLSYRNIGSITTPSLQIDEENNYYPFGLKQMGYNTVSLSTNDALKYKYNGKELQDELGLNMYDYGARNYDPALGRWMNIDPLAEISRRFSPYVYALNNPVFFIDPDGMTAVDPIYGKTGLFGSFHQIGDDGKNDGKIHIVTNNSQSREIENKTEKGDTAIDLSNTDKVTLNGGKATVDGVVASVDAEEKDTSTGANDAGLHEEGGNTQKDANGKVETKAWTPGIKKTGTNNASISPFGGVTKPSASGLLDYWHVHTSGEITSTDPVTNEPVTYSAKPGPSGSTGDMGYQGTLSAQGYNATAIQVDTRGGKTVNFYNSSTTTFSISYESFKKLK